MNAEGESCWFSKFLSVPRPRLWGEGWKKKSAGLCISPVLNGGLQGSPPTSFLIPNSPTYSTCLWWRLLLWGEGRQELTKESETLDSLDPSP